MEGRMGVVPKRRYGRSRAVLRVGSRELSAVRLSPVMAVLVGSRAGGDGRRAWRAGSLPADDRGLSQHVLRPSSRRRLEKARKPAWAGPTRVRAIGSAA